MSAGLAGKLKHYRISQKEHDRACELLGREPRESLKGLEWALFSALWSEHCSYKSSKIHLRKFAKTMNSTVVNAAGENAGVVDLGQGERIVFKMESHNHPSFIEPYQGAATGVGGILRDIFTMGARPIGSANYLCFGEPQAERMPALVDGVVRGIAGYGNSVGVPTVTGQTNFDPSYNKNILVNAMSLGLLRPGEKVALSAAKGPGNHVVYVGAKTGKDGIHGASMASESFDENSEAKKPNVQIGDPYFEKLLIESCLEVLQKDLVVSIQDMGAAGLTSSSFEMASKGEVGMRLHLDRVPVRDSSIQPEEILLSESQERMLLICEPKKLATLQQHFSRWGLDAVAIGEVIAERRVELWWKGEKLTDIDPHILVEKAPVYERPYSLWKDKNRAATPDELKTEPGNMNAWILSVLADVHGTNRQDVYRQYDQRVGLRTVRGADHDVAVLRLPDSQRGLSMGVGCRTHVMKLDAKLGGYDSVLYPILQMSVKGFSPVAITDCLNFGNPEKPEIMSEFVAAVEAITEVSMATNAPVVSGNVSFYNETLGENIVSTPAIGVIGLRADIKNIPQDMFQKNNSIVFRLAETHVFGKSAFPTFAESQGEKALLFGEINVPALARWAAGLKELSLQSGVLATQMVSRGGLALSLAKMCTAGLGFRSEGKINFFEISQEFFYQAIIEVDEAQVETFQKRAKELQLKVTQIGRVQPGSLKIGEWVDLPVTQIQQQYGSGLRGKIESLA